MKTAHALAIIAAAMLSCSSAIAQTVPDQLVGGSVSLAIGGLSLRQNCYVGHSLAFFQRNGLGTKAVISLAEITDGGNDLAGQAVLTFTSATGGTIHFKQVVGLTDPAFTAYGQSFGTDPLKFSVAFIINFPDCALPIRAVFDLT